VEEQLAANLQLATVRATNVIFNNKPKSTCLPAGRLGYKRDESQNILEFFAMKLQLTNYNTKKLYISSWSLPEHS